MMHVNSRSVTVDRLKLIAQLKVNLEQHKKDYAEAVIGYRLKLQADLSRKLDEVTTATYAEALLIKPVAFNPPQSYESQYVDAIEMLQWSTQDTIELDEGLFKAWIQNKWQWSGGFDSVTTMYKSFAAGASLG